MDFLTCAVTDVGISKKTNQDSYLIKTANTKIGKVVFAAVCDGMGGLAKGELASATVIKAFSDWFNISFPQLLHFGINEKLITQQWNAIIQEQNRKIMAYGRSQGIQLGTTICAILMTQTHYYYLNVGDSRLYEIAGYLKQITVDQTLVQREVEYGKITEEQAKVDPRRSILLQCVGCNEKVNPFISSGVLVSNATYMLCSDGFRHAITPDEIYSYLNPVHMTTKENMRYQLSTLITINKQRMENDNITALAVRTY